MEDFYTISLPVKNLNNLTDSLDAFASGDLISDYRCEACTQLVDIQRINAISEFPNYFMIHLQKIIFDMNRFQNVKVNTKFEFPTVLDLENYSVKEILKQHGIDPDDEMLEAT